MQKLMIVMRIFISFRLQWLSYVVRISRWIKYEEKRTGRLSISFFFFDSFLSCSSYLVNFEIHSNKKTYILSNSLSLRKSILKNRYMTRGFNADTDMIIPKSFQITAHTSKS